ncbi:hypothetical protein ACFV23_05345 [Streptomyces sp. NPDC059627]
MSTPGNMQESSKKTYTDAITLLGDARTKMTTVQSQVQDAAADLQARYQGADGQAYAQVMKIWLEEVDRIKHTCMAMENQLTNSMNNSENTQSGNLDLALGQKNLSAFGLSPASDAVFSQLT